MLTKIRILDLGQDDPKKCTAQRLARFELAELYHRISNLPQMENPINIAVVDFNGNNISTGETIALSDRLRIELVKTKY